MVGVAAVLELDEEEEEEEDDDDDELDVVDELDLDLVDSSSGSSFGSPTGSPGGVPPGTPLGGSGRPGSLTSGSSKTGALGGEVSLQIFSHDSGHGSLIHGMWNFGISGRSHCIPGIFGQRQRANDLQVPGGLQTTAIGITVAW